MNTLLLTSEERHLFDSLSESLREGWHVDAEEGNAYESQEELVIRYQMATFRSPAVHDFANALSKSATPADIEATARKFDFSELSQEEVAELFFILGAKVTGAMIVYLLKNAKDDEDMEGAEVLTQIRHMLFETNSQSFL